MNAKNNIVLRMEGLPENGGNLDLNTYAVKIAQFKDVLHKITNAESGEDDARVKFRVTDLAHSSPASLVCVPVAAATDASTVIATINDVFKSITNRATEHIPNPVLLAVKKLATPSGTESLVMETTTNGDPYICEFDKKFSSDIEAVLRAELKSIGSVRGKLESINIHGVKNNCTVYTFSAPVKCSFGDDLLEQVRKALGKYVSVSGQCFFHPSEATPHTIKVAEIDILPDSKDRPSFEDIRGIAPDITGDKTTEQFVRELRAAWGD